jgi:membrane fusion protein (multidrug efflux system)
VKNLRKWSLAIAVILVIIGALVAYKVLDIKAEIAELEMQPEYSESVEAARAESIAFTPSTQVLGVVVAPQKLELRSELAGRIQDVRFASGEQVSKGQLLIQMDISEELAQLNSAKARAELAKSTNKRIASLRHSNAVSEERYDETLAELRVAEAEIALLQATIEKKTLRAPFDAIAGIHQFEAGQYLEENTFITTLVGLQDYVWVDFSLPQFYNPLPVGAPVSIASVPGSAGATGADALEAQIIARNSTISSDARSLQYRARVETSGFSLIPNSIVSVLVPVGQSLQKVAVPSVAILHSAAGPYVYRLIADEQAGGYRAKQQPVTLGQQVGGMTIVESGLADGEQVAAAGAFKLSDGLLAYISATAVGVASEPSTEALP